jgi:hypothetical protein
VCSTIVSISISGKLSTSHQAPRSRCISLQHQSFDGMNHRALVGWSCAPVKGCHIDNFELTYRFDIHKANQRNWCQSDKQQKSNFNQTIKARYKSWNKIGLLSRPETMHSALERQQYIKISTWTFYSQTGFQLLISDSKLFYLYTCLWIFWLYGAMLINFTFTLLNSPTMITWSRPLRVRVMATYISHRYINQRAINYIICKHI